MAPAIRATVVRHRHGRTQTQHSKQIAYPEGRRGHKQRQQAGSQRQTRERHHASGRPSPTMASARWLHSSLSSQFTMLLWT
jgi:hypothetical protein